MTASEFAFLAIGLVLGIAAGAAVIVALRARSMAAREVRVTMAADAIPRRRAATLADDAFADAAAAAEPARGGPADHWGGAPDRRTPVRVPRVGTVVEPAFRLTGPVVSAVSHQAVHISSGVDPMLTALRASAAASATAAMSSAQIATAVLEHADSDPLGAVPDTESASADTAVGNPTTSRSLAPTGPCEEARRLAGERCELAGRARAQATVAEDTHRATQHAYDDLVSATADAAATADPRAIRRAKDEAQARFRASRAGAQTTGQVDAAARDWLLGINKINAAVREATAELARERAAAPAVAANLERTSLEADAARIAAETAEATCLAARQDAADCEEREAGGLPGHLPAMPSQGSDDDGSDPGDHLAAALDTGSSPRIFRLLRGDRMAMHEMIGALAGDAPDERRRWQVALSDFVDAIVADSLAASALEFPPEHVFWGTFTQAQGRDIVAALSSLGYRFDGLGGWVDGRTPSQRDLSLAIGYSGLDPMRMRHWPTDAEMADLFADVLVAAAEHLAGAAGDLTLGELVAMLGRRADSLTEVWNAWGHIRPLLLEER